MTFVTRFAPSPTGPLHLGHAYSAILAHDMAIDNDGTFLLRLEDIDQSRARLEWETQIYDDLTWLGLSWQTPVRRQSDHLPLYQQFIDHLWQDGLLYKCTCSRADIRAALSAPQEGAAIHGPDGPVYPGTCRDAEFNKIHSPNAPDAHHLRLNMAHASHALRNLGRADDLGFRETGSGPDGQTGWIAIDLDALNETVGDVIIARRDMGTSYHLSVVIDDMAQGITHIVRGSDLFEATYIHVILQRLLNLPTPSYHHHRLIRDDMGKRLAKRDDARAISKYRDEGKSPEDIRAMVGLPSLI
ncbi:tRNA glutamyl-Q(34) synthetase GluQRS [uncultured Tateyamaria sp.]|uniref:tRNA glutamyl-Q(34) synthetase GluQRS n=1 Tax=uncultured Tateyamaria sp. TaxID=455651 RepID=UPI0026317439|nr:tRNA glutamyl-Q(34) synthetase GluQRS [uncultured Tateyamaria sp.]